MVNQRDAKWLLIYPWNARSYRAQVWCDVGEIISRRDTRRQLVRSAVAYSKRRREFKPRIQRHVRLVRITTGEKRRYRGEIRRDIIHSAALYEVALVMNFKTSGCHALGKYTKKNAMHRLAFRPVPSLFHCSRSWKKEKRAWKGLDSWWTGGFISRISSYAVTWTWRNRKFPARTLNFAKRYCRCTLSNSSI